MFVSQTRFRRNPKQFFYDKSFLMGSNSERLVNPFLERVCSPKGKLAYNNFSIMQTEKNFVQGIQLSGAHNQINLITFNEYKRACKLSTISGFKSAFYKLLLSASSSVRCFELINEEYRKIFGEHRFSNYESFISRLSGDGCSLYFINSKNLV